MKKIIVIWLLLLSVGVVFNMMQIRDLSPKLNNLQSAERELYFPQVDTPIGQRVGGLAMYSNSFKRGAGDRVFGSDDNGIWLGAANFADAPFQVDMDGNAILNSAAVGGYSKVTVYKQNGIPTSVAIGDLWFDTDDSNKIYRAGAVGATTIASGQWELLNDLRAADALTKAGVNQAVSGQVIVGGSVDGSLIVKDSSNAVKAVLDKDGLLVVDGKIEIRNTDDDSVLDFAGVISETQFLNGSVVQSSPQTTTSTSMTDISGVSLSLGFDRTQNVLVTVDVTGYNSSLFVPNANTLVALNVDGSDQAKLISLPGEHNYDDGSQYANTASITFLLTLGTGVHTLKLRFKTTNGSYTAVVAYATITYVALGR